MPAANIVYVDSFSRYATAGLDEAGWTVTTTGGSVVISSGNGRFGGASLRVTTASNTVQYVTRTFSAQAAWCVGLSVRVNNLASVIELLTLLDAGTSQCDLRTNSDGTLSVTRAGTALTNGTSTLALAPNIFYHIEWIVTIADSIGAGTCVVKVNGVTWITVATGQDTKVSANASANQLRIGKASGVNVSITIFDYSDLVVQNGSGSDFLGDRRVDFLAASTNGNSSQFTGSDGNSTDNYLLVDDATPDDDTTYVESGTVGHKDLYGLANLGSTPATIDCLQTVIYNRMTDAGPRTLCPVLRSGGTDYDQTNFNQASSYAYNTEIELVDPATAVAWTASGVNALELGMKVIA